MKHGKFLLLSLVAALLLTGCSQYTCFYGSCKTIGAESQAAKVLLSDPNATRADLTAGLRRIADYSQDLYDNSKPFKGAYANATYHSLLIRLVGDSESAARRAELQAVDDTWKRAALAGLATVLDKLEMAMHGQKGGE